MVPHVAASLIREVSLNTNQNALRVRQVDATAKRAIRASQVHGDTLLAVHAKDWIHLVQCVRQYGE